VSRPSLILVTVDCLRADHVGFLGYQRPTTPFLDSLAKESFVVPNAIVGGVPTYYSFPAILASRSPLALGRDLIGLAPGEPSLPGELKKAGYETAAFVAANPYISAHFGYDQDWDVFRDFLDKVTPDHESTHENQNGLAARLNHAIARLSYRVGPAGRLYNELYFRYCQRAAPVPESIESLRPYPSAETVVQEACKWLASVSSEPFFLWLHFMDAHAPYYPPNDALRAMNIRPVTASQARYVNSYWNRSDVSRERLEARREEITSLYDAGIRWVDEQVRRMASFLQNLQCWKRCAFVFTADHGEELLEHGGRFHPPTAMSEELVHVPLLVRIPGVEPQAVSTQPFSQIDLAPTILDAMNLAIPVEFQGASRWAEWRNLEDPERIAIVESANCFNPNRSNSRLAPRVLCVRGARYKLTLRFPSLQTELFDLEQDPAEENPLPENVERAIRASMLEHARAHLRKLSLYEPAELRLRARMQEIRRVLPEDVASMNEPDVSVIV